jgi:hypothetical protein
MMRVLETLAGLRPPRHVLDRMATWLREQDLIPPDDLTGWTIADWGEGRWMLTPSGYSGVILVVTLTDLNLVPTRDLTTDDLEEGAWCQEHDRRSRPCRDEHAGFDRGASRPLAWHGWGVPDGIPLLRLQGTRVVIVAGGGCPARRRV